MGLGRSVNGTLKLLSLTADNYSKQENSIKKSINSVIDPNQSEKGYLHRKYVYFTIPAGGFLLAQPIEILKLNQ